MGHDSFEINITAIESLIWYFHQTAIKQGPIVQVCNYVSMYKKSISDISMMKLNRSNIITQYILGTNKISLVKQMLHMEDKINKQYGEHKKNIKKWRMIKPEHPNQATFLRFH